MELEGGVGLLLPNDFICGVSERQILNPVSDGKYKEVDHAQLTSVCRSDSQTFISLCPSSITIKTM